MNSREELVRIYLDKRPEAAAHLLESLSLEESVTLLSELPTRTSGPVLAAVISPIRRFGAGTASGVVRPHFPNFGSIQEHFS